MFERCAGCGTRLISSGASFGGQKFCNQGCVAAYHAKLAVEAVPEDALEEAVREVFEGKCPSCGGPGPNEVYSATKVTGMIVVFQVQSLQKLCCASCGRKQRLGAAGHCALAGWWGVRSAFINLFVLPTNLIAAATIRPPREPSAKFRAAVRAGIGAQLISNARRG